MKGKTSRSANRSGKIKVTVDRDSRVDVRQIDNGFIVRESGTKGKGKSQRYYEKEFFSRTNPLKINGVSPSSGSIKFGK